MHLLTRIAIVLSAGAAVCAPAQGSSRRAALLNPRAADADERAPTGWPVGAGARPIGATSLDLSGAFGAVARGIAGGDGSLATLDTGFESLAPLPADLVNQLDTVQWGGAAAGVTGRAHFSTVTGLSPPQYGVVSNAVAGNATKKLRGLASPAFGPNEFFGRWARCNFYKTNTASPTQVGAQRFIFSADTGESIRVVHDTFVTSLSSLWTSEPTYAAAGFLAGRLLWGGENQSTGIGLPIGPITHFYGGNPGYYGCWEPGCELTLGYEPCRFMDAAPAGHKVGDQVAIPVGAWFKLIWEFDASNRGTIKIDYNDGAGEFTIFTFLPAAVARLDRVAFSGGFDHLDDACFIDNIHVEGVEAPPTPTPPQLACPNNPGGGYLDDMDWLPIGAVSNQRWIEPGYTAVAVPSASGRAIRVTNPDPPNPSGYPFGGDLRTSLPPMSPSPGSPVRVCADVDLHGAASGAYGTAQRVALIDSQEGSIGGPPEITNGALIIGRHVPGQPFDPTIYVEVEGYFDGGESGEPRGQSLLSTGVTWPIGAGPRSLCVGIDAQGFFTASLDGVDLVGGSGGVTLLARGTYTDAMRFQSLFGGGLPGDVLQIDNLRAECAGPYIAALPPFALPLVDDLSWGLEGADVRTFDDDANPGTPFRWSTDLGARFIAAPGQGMAAQLFQFRGGRASLTTATPTRSSSSTFGWAVSADLRMESEDASWYFLVMSQGGVPSGGLEYRADHDRFSIQRPGGGANIPTQTSAAGVGVAQGEWFRVSVHANLDGRFNYRFNGRLMRDQGAVVSYPISPAPRDVSGVRAEAVNWGGGDAPAPLLSADNFRVWALPCLGDATDDGVVNFADLNIVLSNFGATPPPGTFGSDLPGNIAPDANNDGVPDDDVVNFADLNAVLSGFGVPCN